MHMHQGTILHMHRSADSASCWQVFTVMCTGQVRVGVGVVMKCVMLSRWQQPTSAVQPLCACAPAHPPQLTQPCGRPL